MIQDNPRQWSQGNWGSEHPDTARIRVEKEYVDTMVALKRENMDRIAAYLDALIEKAKEELGHARAGSAEHRKQATRQHIDEIIAYLKGQSLDVAPPAEAHGAYVLDDVSQFFGRVRCVLDQWYDSHLIALYDEMLVLVKLKGEAKVRQPVLD